MITSVKDMLPGDAELIFDALRHLTVGRVVNFLNYTFDSCDHEILDLAEGRAKWATTPMEYATHSSAVLASNAAIVFFGGPPNEGEWYSGSLLAMLVDRLLYNRAIGNTEVVQRFMGAMGHA
jgi:hypothetical protein